jgi:cell division protein ZapA
MSNLNLTIGGRIFAVACADGEEAHVTRLGKIIDSKVTESGLAGQSEARMLLFAALLLADENHDLAGKVASGHLNDLPDALDERLALLAERLENLASLLEA